MFSQTSSSKSRRLPIIRENSANSSLLSRKSKWGRTSIKSGDNIKGDGSDNRRPIVTYFPCKKVHEIMLKVLENSSFTKNLRYDSMSCGDQIRNISNEIKNQVKTFLMENYLNRYKIVVNVISGSVDATDLVFASRFVWDTEKDTFVEAKMRTKEKYIVAVLYAVHQD